MATAAIVQRGVFLLVLLTTVGSPMRGACHDLPANVDRLLHVRIGDQVQERPIRWIDGKPQWQEFSFDLSRWAGQRVTVVPENAVLGKQAWEAGFWTAPEFRDADGKPLGGQRPAGRSYRYPLEFAPKILPETFAVLVGLLYGDGDFRRSVSLTTMCGFDTDCNAGTVGCLLGLRNGLEHIPAEWKDPLGDTYELQVTGLPRQWTIRELAREMAQTGAALARRQRPPAKAAGSTLVAPATSVPAVAPQSPMAVDSAEGFGATSRGGEGGRVIMVTTNRSWPGARSAMRTTCECSRMCGSGPAEWAQAGSRRDATWAAVDRRYLSPKFAMAKAPDQTATVRRRCRR